MLWICYKKRTEQENGVRFLRRKGTLRPHAMIEAPCTQDVFKVKIIVKQSKGIAGYQMSVILWFPGVITSLIPLYA